MGDRSAGDGRAKHGRASWWEPVELAVTGGPVELAGTGQVAIVCTCAE